MYSKILQYNIFNETKEELLESLENYDKVNIVSGNPQILYAGLSNKQLFDSFMDESSIIIPDGVGTVVAAKIAGKPVKEKIAGIEIMDRLLEKCAKEGKSVYLLGAEEETLNLCINNIKIKYHNLNVAGSHNGFFSLDSCENIINDIKETNPYAIFIAMGVPRQEMFILNYMQELPCRIYMGVGGSFDIFAGKLKRAPRWMIKLGLEWLYRVAKEPFRIKRLSSIPKFILKVIYNTYIIKDNI